MAMIMSTQYAAHRAIDRHHRNGQLSTAAIVYSAKHTQIVVRPPNHVAIVSTFASLSALISGTAENACIAIARASHAMIYARLILPSGLMRKNPKAAVAI